MLKKVMEIDADQVEASVGEHNVALLQFVREAYARICGIERLWKRSANAQLPSLKPKRFL